MTLRRKQPAVVVKAKDAEMRAAEIKNSWSDPDSRFKSDPDFALCLAVLNRARIDVIDGQKSLNALREAKNKAEQAIHAYYNQILDTRRLLKNAAVAINWAERPEYQWLALDTIAKRTDYDPERLAEVIINGMHGGVARFISGKQGSMCPICKKEL